MDATKRENLEGLICLRETKIEKKTKKLSMKFISGKTYITIISKGVATIYYIMSITYISEYDWLYIIFF